jgi:integrase
MSKILIRSYEGTIYPEGSSYTGAIDLGCDGQGRRQRIKRKGRTKQIVKDKLVKAVDDLEAGIETSDSYTVAEAVEDWLERGMRGYGESTVTTYQLLAKKNLIPLIGAAKLKKLSADDVDSWLDGLTGSLSTDSLKKVHSVLRRAIRRAEARDKVGRNVAALVTTPKGRKGRPSRALTLDQATRVLEEARARPLYAYVALSLLTGVRTEEARALRWSHVVAWEEHVVAWEEKAGEWQPVSEAGFDHGKFAVYVWRSVRTDGDTKTEKSRRTLEIPDEAAEALGEHHKRQAAQRLRAGSAWQDNDLVFCTRNGTALAAGNVRRGFKAITKAAGLGEDWTPRELRHTFVSILSANEVSIEAIADLVGHRTTIVTQKVYRHQLRPVMSKGATTMNAIFSKEEEHRAG